MAHPERPRPTIYDVAAACGVAPSTVSRTFSRPGRVNAETAERIRRVAAEMGYRTNPLAKALPTGKTSLLAVIVSDVTNPFFFEILSGAEDAAHKEGYTLLVADARESADAERGALDRTIPIVEGLVLATSRLSDLAIRMAAKQRPTVLLNRSMSDVPSVATDNARGTRQAVEHLAAFGHTGITYVSGPDASWANGIRWQALREAAAQRDVRTRRVGPFAPTREGGDAAVDGVLAAGSTAVMCYNDLMAIGLLKALTQRGVRVPEDVSVIGYDNIFGSDFCTPTLTTVAAPLRMLGAFAVETLIRDLRGQDTSLGRTPGAPLKTALLPAQLLERESTGPAATSR
jgi:LacI family transcriptional regulator, repressor for deo operon, udp, cdd, tsx, nupC, and nupG